MKETFRLFLTTSDLLTTDNRCSRFIPVLTQTLWGEVKLFSSKLEHLNMLKLRVKTFSSHSTIVKFNQLSLRNVWLTSESNLTNDHDEACVLSSLQQLFSQRLFMRDAPLCNTAVQPQVFVIPSHVLPVKPSFIQKQLKFELFYCQSVKLGATTVCQWNDPGASN